MDIAAAPGFIAAIPAAVAVTHLTAKPTSNVEATFDSVNPRA